jgi:hypothetical protein
MEATFDAHAIEFGTVDGTVAAGTNTMQLGTVNGTVTAATNTMQLGTVNGVAAATNTMQQTSAFAAPYGTSRRPVVTGRHARPGKVTVLAIGRAVPEMMIKNEGLADNFLRDANVDDPIMLAKLRRLCKQRTHHHLRNQCYFRNWRIFALLRP